MAIERITIDGLEAYLRRVGTPYRDIREIVLHHTWAPTAAQFTGAKTWQAIRAYHMDTRGWSDIGYHFGIGPDGSIWRLRPVEKSGAHVLNRNQHTVGVAMVGNFDVEDPVANGLGTAAQVVRILCDHFRLSAGAVRFHREFQNKTCPGTRLDLADFRRRVFGAQPQVPTTPDKHAPPLVIGLDGLKLTEGKIIGDRLWAPVADVAREFGASVVWHGEQGKGYLERPGAGGAEKPPGAPE